MCMYLHVGMYLGGFWGVGEARYVMCIDRKKEEKEEKRKRIAEV